MPTLARLLPLVACALRCAAAEPATSSLPSVTLQWLGGTPPAGGASVTWGVPWPKGALHLRQPLSLKGGDGAEIPVQSWPLAYWPDGSLKWTAQASTVPAGAAGPFILAAGPESTAPAAPRGNRGQAPSPSAVKQLTWKATGDGIDIDTGILRCRILKHDTSVLFASLQAGDTMVAENARLTLLVADHPRSEDAGSISTTEYVSRIDKVTLEQAGPIRATVKLEGTHVGPNGRTLLPFVVRLYFYAGQSSLHIVHSIVFDGDANKDFIRGLGLVRDVPLRDAVENRHVRFAGDTGMWAEPVEPLVGRRIINLPDGGNVFPGQLAGHRIPAAADFNEQGQTDLANAARWSDFHLAQTSPNGFSVDKRTSDASSWVHVMDGHRSLGLVFLGDTHGGLAAQMRDFWQKYPAALDIRGATTPRGQIRLWFWSPDAPPMDLRHYDTVAHGLEFSYEDVEPGFSSPYGIGNTSEVTLWALPAVPENAELVRLANSANQPALLVCAPEYYHQLQSFGIWSLPDHSSPARQAVEDQLSAGLSFYKNEVDQRNWYGFWDYGDFRRMYDELRHEWRYDIGGWAWNNTELMPNLWLWYSFLRTGRADIYRLAEAMTRQTQEVDCYHLGPWKGLGSRHSVVHWGDSAKQPRISNAGLKNIYYYLTADERTGDLMHEVVDADIAAALVDPLRDVRAVGAYPMRSGFGFESTWPAFAINWMTEWERTRDPRWRDKILVGMKTMLEIAPPGQPMSIEGGYDPATGRFFDEGRGDGPLAPLFGGPEICFQLMQEIDYPEFWKAWTEMASRGNGRLLAYAAAQRHDAEMGRRVWTVLNRGVGGTMRAAFNTKLQTVTGPDVPATLQEVPGRPEAAGDGQRMLDIIECLDLAGQYLPDIRNEPPPPARENL